MLAIRLRSAATQTLRCAHNPASLVEARPSLTTSSPRCTHVRKHVQNEARRRSITSVPLRAARKLPEPVSAKRRVGSYIVLASVLGLSIVVAFNHQKASSGICHSTYWAVRRDPIAKRLLGDHITYRDYWPWVAGEVNQIKGNIQLSYAIKGDKQAGRVYFHCIRRTRNSQDWQILDWRLVADDGTESNLTPDAVEPAVDHA